MSGALSKPDSVSLRIRYAVPIFAGDEAELHVRVQESVVGALEAC